MIYVVIGLCVFAIVASCIATIANIAQQNVGRALVMTALSLIMTVLLFAILDRVP